MTPSARRHVFFASAFVENLPLKELSAVFPGATATRHELRMPVDSGGTVFFYPFGVVVFLDVLPDRRERELLRLQRAMPNLSAQVVKEDFVAKEDGALPTGFREGVLNLDRMTPERAAVIALTIAQSVAMEYYESLVEKLYARTATFVERLEVKGTVSASTRPMTRFIGEALGTRNEVLTVLHLLDKPDEAWDDAVMDEIYDDLKQEFDLDDRYHALELKLKSIQESLELLLDVARDKRLFFLEATVVLLIVIEIVLSLVRH